MKKIKKELKRIYITYSESRSGGACCKGDSGPWASREDAFIDITFKFLHKDYVKDSFFYHSLEIEDESLLEEKNLCLCVVRYSTGDTFGRTNGAWEVVGITKIYKEAEELLKEETKDKNAYKPWNGYFERLEGTEIHVLPLV